MCSRAASLQLLKLASIVGKGVPSRSSTRDEPNFAGTVACPHDRFFKWEPPKIGRSCRHNRSFRWPLSDLDAVLPPTHLGRYDQVQNEEAKCDIVDRVKPMIDFFDACARAARLMIAIDPTPKIKNATSADTTVTAKDLLTASNC